MSYNSKILTTSSKGIAAFKAGQFSIASDGKVSASSGAYSLIQSQTIGTAVNTVTFTNIPSTYNEIIGVFSNVTFTSAGNIFYQFSADNFSTTTSIDAVYFVNSGTPAVGQYNSTTYLAKQGAASVPIMGYIHLFNMSSSLIKCIRSFIGTNGGTSSSSATNVPGAGTIISTNKINAIKVSTSATFSAGTFELYGM